MATPRTGNGKAQKVAAPMTDPRLRVYRDSLQNLMSGLGTTKDKRTYSTHVTIEMSRQQLEAAFRSDWVARKIVTLPAKDATREGRAWQAEGDAIEKIEAVEKNLRFQKKLARALTLNRLYGGSLMFLGLKNDQDPGQELNIKTVKKDSLQFIHVMHRHEISTGQLIRDVLSPFYGQPEYYELQGQNGQIRVHPSRVIRFTGEEHPDPMQQPGGWGDSCLQAIDDAIKDVGMCSGGLAQLIWEMKIDVVRLPNFMAQIAQKEYRDVLIERFELANLSKSLINTLIMDKEEEWQRISTSLTGVDDVLKIYLLIASGAANIPATVLLGQSPQGLNATGDSDTRNYYDRLSSDQKTDITPTIEPLDEIIIRSALGSRPEDIFYNWNPLWQLSDAEEADVAKKKAETFQIDVSAGLIPSLALAEARVNQLVEDGTYPGLEQIMNEVDLEAELSQVEEDDPEVIAAEEARLANENEEEEPSRKAVGDAWRYAIQKRKRRKKMKIKDATPKTLYVRRDVVNKAELLKWARASGLAQFGEIVENLHVTIIYSKSQVDWGKAREGYDYDPKGECRVAPGGMRMIDKLGIGGSVAALLFTSEKLSWRHCQIKSDLGCSYDWDYYQPHITFVYGSDNQPIDFELLRKIEPYRGEIILGPEIWEETKTDEEIAVYKAGV